jgi:hypothetical protein
VALAVLALAACGEDDPPGRGEVGGPPSSTFPRTAPEEHIRQETKPVVIARGDDPRGKPFEVVAYQSSSGLCIDVDRGRQSGGGCGSSLRQGRKIEITETGETPHESSFSGRAIPETDRVQFSYCHEGRRKEIRATLARVEGDLLAKLRVKKPFGYFVVILPGRVPQKSVFASAYGEDGRFLGRAIGADFSVKAPPTRVLSC